MSFVKYGDDMTSTAGAGIAATHGTRIQNDSFPNLGQDIAYLTVFPWIFSVLRNKFWDSAAIWPRPLTSRFFPSHHSNNDV